MRVGGSIGWLRALAVGFIVAFAPTVQADEPKKKAEGILSDLGVVLEKTRYIYADDEKALMEKYEEAKAAREQARVAMGKIEQGQMIQQGILALQAEEQQIQAEIGAIRAQSAGMSYGRRRGGNYYRNEANAMIREEEAMRNQIKSQITQANKQKPSAKQQQSDQIAARAAMERAQQVLKDVNDAYDSLEERYNQARAKPGVIQALEDAGYAKKVSLRLGPSEESDKIGKWVKGILKIRPKRSTVPAAKPAADKPAAEAGKSTKSE
ncbi:hypothetical protein [Paludisphaera rhizosphaerae]|uniref:hypothetical protein n=1 Tax=Paludisphaera rhizosphaerae TaxID=2711216 RepID=UPI0013EA3B75|nr:hypothetical protein [Paludisphaera rhizosphaerae]